MKLIHQTIKEGDFVWLGLENNASGSANDYSFKVSGSARFVELRCENAFGTINSKKKLDDAFVKYNISFTIMGGDFARCLIEAYIEH